MKTSISQLLNTCLEIEGLLCLVERRGESIPDNIATLLMEKTTVLKNGMAEFTSNSVAYEVKPIELPTPQVAVVEAKSDEPDEERIAESVELEEKEDAEPEANTVQPTEPAVEVKPDRTEPTHVEQLSAPELTVNDKFRFRRELFANSDVDLAEALQIAAKMSTVEEIEDYFYNDLCFDPENETVKDFMRIVAKRQK